MPFVEHLSIIQGKFNSVLFLGETVVKMILCLSPEQMSVVGITENAKGDNKKFEVWCNSREEVYIVQVGSSHRNGTV